MGRSLRRRASWSSSSNCFSSKIAQNKLKRVVKFLEKRAGRFNFSGSKYSFEIPSWTQGEICCVHSTVSRKSSRTLSDVELDLMRRNDVWRVAIFLALLAELV